MHATIARGGLRVLTVNAGSSSLKLHVLDPADRIVGSDNVEHADGVIDRARLESAISAMGRIDAVGHRVVHGGTAYSAPVLLDSTVRARLAEYVALAPLHQPLALAGIDTVAELLPDAPMVACFDTAFHQTLPPAAYTYAIPAQWRDRYQLRRYGFHGLSHRHAAHRAAELVGRPVAELRIVSAHLGAGASLAAIAGGRSVDTTMGFTPLEGLVMATRSGSVDPGLLLWLQDNAGLTASEIAAALEHRSGLAALAGSADMRTVLSRTDPQATLAIQVYTHRLRGLVGAMAAALGGVDVLVFTGGVGEHAPVIRAAATDGMEFLGVAIDSDRNSATDGDGDISTESAGVRTVVVAAREDIEIARGVRQVL